MNASIFRLDLSSNDVALMRAERPPLFGIQVYDPQSQKGKYGLSILGCHFVNLLVAQKSFGVEIYFFPFHPPLAYVCVNTLSSQCIEMKYITPHAFTF